MTEYAWSIDGAEPHGPYATVGKARTAAKAALKKNLEAEGILATIKYPNPEDCLDLEMENALVHMDEIAEDQGFGYCDCLIFETHEGAEAAWKEMLTEWVRKYTFSKSWIMDEEITL